MIRRAEIGDLNDIFSMHSRLMEEEGTDVPRSPGWAGKLIQFLTDLLDSKEAVIFMAEQNRELVGTIMAISACGPPYLLQTGAAAGLYVKPEARGGRVGPQLIATATRWLRAHDNEFVLIATRGKNRNKGFYRRLGLSEVAGVCVMPLREAR